MEVKEKLSLEKSGEKIIRLYKEGIFYIAYNHSAVRFRHFINGNVKILKHELKNGDWYLRIGVVQTSSMLENIPLKDPEGKFRDYIEIECDEMETSLEEVSDFIMKRYGTKNIKKEKTDDEKVTNNREKEVIELIRNLNLGTITPVAAITWISKWQDMLK